MRYVWMVALLATGCIDEESKPTEDTAEDAGTGDAGASTDAAGGDDDDAAGGGDGAVVADARPAPDAAPIPDMFVAPDGGSGDACEAFCDRLDECFAPACPQVGARGVAGICDSACDLPEAQLRASTRGSCDDFNARIIDAIPQLERVCGGDEPPPVDAACEARCGRAMACGLGVPPQGCARFCRQIPPQLTACFDEAPDCEAFNACVESPPPPGQCEDLCGFVAECGFTSEDECLGFCDEIPPPLRRCAAEADACPDLAVCFGEEPPAPEERCEPLCQRQAQCIFRECAAGSLVDGYVGECFEGCVEAPPTQEALQATLGGLCRDVVAELRADDPALDAACDADDAAVCQTLCEDTIGPCDDAPIDACLAECAGFDEANLRCLQFADGCEGVQACFGDPEGQDRCARFCGRLQGCLEESCPPRVIPPVLGVNCTAGCLDDPPDEAEVQAWEDTACAEVRQEVYRNNRQLAPICEGDRDFRPSGEECAAFCDNGLQACIGLGGRAFCLAACASLTRDEYECSLAAQGECAEIEACLAE